MRLSFRKALPSEAKALTDLAVRSKRVWGYDERFIQRVMPDMIVRPEYLAAEHAIVAEDSGVVVGYAIVSVRGKRAFLRDLFVEPDRQKHGVGKALFSRAFDYAKQRRANELVLHGDPNAIGFYERMGMRKIGEERSIAGRGRVLPIMALELRSDVPSNATPSSLSKSESPE